VETHYLSQPKDINMRLPRGITGCVGFLAHDEPVIKYGGTAFLVGIKQDNDPDRTFLHLVTAAHNAEAIEDGPWVLGMNGRDGGKILVRSGDDMRWWYHPTDKKHVDVAVTIFSTPKLKDYDLGWVPVEMFLSDERIAQSNIGIGDEISIVGLFTRFSGKYTHEAIARIGNIAMMPKEPVPVKDYGPMEAYLAEGRSIGGLSGSPVFVRETVNNAAVDAKGNRYPCLGHGKIHFLGMMQGHWDVPLDFKTTEQEEAVNMGISIVVPAKKILEVLFHPELIEMRKKFEDDLTAENAPVQDSLLKRKAKTEPITRADFEDVLKKVSRKIAPKN
jgi:hypothetical protein